LEWGGCSGGLGAEPPAGSRGRAPGQGIRGAKPEAPLKLKSFEPSEERGSWQICHPVKYCVNCSNILLEKVFVSIHGLRCSDTHSLAHSLDGTLDRRRVGPAAGRSAVQDLWSCAILQASLALSPVSSSICCIHVRSSSTPQPPKKIPLPIGLLYRHYKSARNIVLHCDTCIHDPSDLLIAAFNVYTYNYSLIRDTINKNLAIANRPRDAAHRIL